MSNELSTPKVTYCPSDSYHSETATTFNYGGNPTPVYNPCTAPTTAAPAGAITPPAGQSGGCCSYFVNGEATDVDPQMILAGDENIGKNTAANGAAPYSFTTGSGSPTTPTASYADYFAYNVTAPMSDTAGGAWSWTANEMHQKTGNLLLGDGSVQSVSISGLHDAMRNSTNSVSVQAWNFPR
ncbi:MAG TPA: hypothetical protein VFF11_04475 [Candidatus Binatia bacterium]|nr:hypothetical protein [Candidatus Binatia bacterium]